MADKLLGLVTLQGDMRIKLLELGVPKKTRLTFPVKCFIWWLRAKLLPQETSAAFAEYLEENSEQDSD